jgi:hypothetical protein
MGNPHAGFRLETVARVIVIDCPTLVRLYSISCGERQMETVLCGPILQEVCVI